MEPERKIHTGITLLPILLFLLMAPQIVRSADVGRNMKTYIVQRDNKGNTTIEIKRKKRNKRFLNANISLCANLAGKECETSSTTFTTGDGKIYFHSTIYGASSYIEITHVWYHDGKKVQVVRLPVKSSRWRTWSVRTLSGDSSGNWKVAIYVGEMMIGEKDFRITP
jgi:hypothetical protein